MENEQGGQTRNGTGGEHRTVENYDYPAEVWSTNTTHYVRRYRFVGKKLTGIELDPEKRLVDLNRDNNTWGNVAKKPVS